MILNYLRWQVSLNLLDRYVGSRLKMRRGLLGISQTKMGQITGVTFQQIQKYEKGINRISCGMLYQFAKVLKVPIDYFFEGFENEELNSKLINKLIDNCPIVEEKEIFLLIKYYIQIKDPQTRRNVLSLAQSLTKKYSL